VNRLRLAWDRAGDWLVASDPGRLRLQMAVGTVLTLAVTLGVLYLLTKATGQPLTVALLGVVIAMLSAGAVNDPDPHVQRLTTLLIPLPAAETVRPPMAQWPGTCQACWCRCVASTRP